MTTSLKSAGRSLISAQRRRSLLLLVVEYQKLQSKFPELQSEIQSDIDDHVRQAERTREGDRKAVIETLREWRAAGVDLAVDEIVDDTGLTEKTVRKILAELEDAGLVGGKEDSSRERERGRPTKYYFPL